MKWIRQRVLSGEIITGTFLNLGSSLTAEIAGNAGFDFVLIDLEHGSGDHDSLIVQLQAVAATPAVPLVRIAWNDPPRFKRVLDLGSSGIMVPMVNNEAEARGAVAAMRYPPQGIRGVAGWNRACRFGPGFEEYFSQANDNLLTIVQIETAEAVKNIEAIAAVDGVDVLFVGPMDLSVGLGIARQFDHPTMREAYEKVVGACRKFGKAAGIILLNPDRADRHFEQGFRFLAQGSDGQLVASGFPKHAACLEQFKNR